MKQMRERLSSNSKNGGEGERRENGVVLGDDRCVFICTDRAFHLPF